MSRSCTWLFRHFLSARSVPRRRLVSQRTILLYLRGRTSRALSITTFKSTVPIKVSTPVLYQPIKDVEKMENYEARGTHPVTIGDRLDSRYQVIHKLGHGTYSTIWLARYGKLNRYVAVKVCTADSKSLEIDVLSKLSSPRLSSNIGRAMIPSVLDKWGSRLLGNQACQDEPFRCKERIMDRPLPA
jgi:hypothetical protein